MFTQNHFYFRNDNLIYFNWNWVKINNPNLSQIQTDILEICPIIREKNKKVNYAQLMFYFDIASQFFWGYKCV